MEWRIILPVLCLIGVLHLPGYAVADGNSTVAPSVTSPSNSTNNSTTLMAVASTTTNQTNTGTNQTAAGTNQTTAGTNQTATGTNQTAAGTNQTAAGTNQTAAGTNQTAAGTNQTAAGTNQTATGTNQTAAGTNQTTSGSNQTTIGTTTSTIAPTTAPAKVGKIALVFSLIMEFKEAFSNLDSPESQDLIRNITSQCEPVYKKRFPNFFRMVIKKFSKGSVVTESELQFDTTNTTSPNATDVKDTFVSAINSGNFTFGANSSTITAEQVTDTSNGTNTTASPSTTTQTTTTALTTSQVPVNYNITFKIAGLFTTALSNSNSPEYNSLGNFTTGQLDGFYKNIKGFLNSFIWRFRNGSIIVDAGLRFDKNINSPNASLLAKELAAAVRNQTILLQIDPTSINVTDSSGNTVNKSPVLASMLTALCMTVASLLFSAVMH